MEAVGIDWAKAHTHTIIRRNRGREDALTQREREHDEALTLALSQREREHDEALTLALSRRERGLLHNKYTRAVCMAAVLLLCLGARAQSDNFIVDTADPKLAPQIAQAAEKFRHDLADEWTGKAMPNWSQPCVMTVQVGPNLGAGGATTFVFEKGEVFGWRMSIQGSAERIFDSVLPHEITHMVFASHFRSPLPRWADEGGATSVETLSERSKHQVMLNQFMHSGRSIAFTRLFAMKEYPQDIMPLYAEGYALSEYLIETGGRRKFVDFIGDGLESNDWAGAVKRNYGFSDLNSLQSTWLAWVQQGWPRIKPKQDNPAVAPSPELLASEQRKPRPEPNLVIRVSNPSYNDADIKATETPLRASQPALIADSQAKTIGAQGIVENAGGDQPKSTLLGPLVPIVRPEQQVASQSTPPLTDPFRAYVTRPQPSESPRQTILR
jgi:hypothetical protein